MKEFIPTKTDIACNKLFLYDFLKKVNHPFFHYTSSEAARNIENSKELWLTHYKNFHDKKEFFHGLDLIISYLKSNCESSRTFKDYYERFLSFLEVERKHLNLEMYVICFCKRKNNNYLAKNYRKGKKLCLVEFDFHSDDLGPIPVCVDVIYSKNVFNKNVKKLFFNYANYFYEHRNDSDFEVESFFPSLVKDVFILAIALKQHRYADEEEIRFVKFEEKVLPYSIELMPKTKISLHPY